MKITNTSLIIYKADTDSHLSLPYADGGIKAGFASPAQDYIDQVIDLNKELVKHPASTFYGRVTGDSMIDADLNDGDILIIDKSIQPTTGKMAVCFIDGEFTVKYIKVDGDIVWLIPANKKYDRIKVTPENNFIVWGVVTTIIKKPKEYVE